MLTRSGSGFKFGTFRGCWDETTRWFGEDCCHRARAGFVTGDRRQQLRQSNREDRRASNGTTLARVSSERDYIGIGRFGVERLLSLFKWGFVRGPAQIGRCSGTWRNPTAADGEATQRQSQTRQHSLSIFAVSPLTSMNPIPVSYVCWSPRSSLRAR
jgi:hypothetical protein